MKNYKIIFCITILSIQVIAFLFLVYDLDFSNLETKFSDDNVIKEISGITYKILSPKEIKISESRTILKEEDKLYLIGITNFDDYKAASNLYQFKLFVENKGMDFLFINFPSKSYSNNTNYKELGQLTNFKEKNQELIEYIKKNMDILDISELLYPKYGDELFYKTDHHWKIKYAKEAAQETIKYLNENLNYNLDSSELEDDQFEEIKGKKWLGELGRKTSKTWSGLDDFTIIKPKYETSFSLNEKYGSFDILLNHEILEKEQLDYYNDSNYYTYCYRCNHKATLTNNEVTGPRVLLIHDSYAMAYAPFLSLAVQEITFWDMRKANEPIKSYINKNEFDIVIVAYSQLYKTMMYNFN